MEWSMTMHDSSTERGRQPFGSAVGLLFISRVDRLVVGFAASTGGWAAPDVAFRRRY